MKNLLLVLFLLSSFAYSQTDCASSNIGVYDSKGALISSHTQGYKANTAAILLAQQQGKATVKTPDIVCTAKISSSSSSRSSSATSAVSSAPSSQSSAASSAPVSGLVAYDNFDGNTSGISWPGGVFAGVAPSPSGGNALRFQYLADSVHSEQRFYLNNSYDEIWIKFRLRVPTNFNHSNGSVNGQPSNIKLFALYMDDYSHHGTGATILWEYWDNGSGGSDLAVHYSEGNNSITGPHLQGVPFISVPGDRGRWMEITLHAKKSSSRNSRDGIIETWRKWDGESVATKLHTVTGALMPAPSSGSITGWNGGYILGWANPTFVDETIFYIDDIRFSNVTF